MLALRRFYQKCGLTLYPFRRWLSVLTIISAVMSILLVFAESLTSQRFLLPSLVATLWFLFFVSLAYYADSAGVPPKPQGCLPALAWSLHNAWTYFLAILFLLATLGLIYISMTAARLALS